MNSHTVNKFFDNSITLDHTYIDNQGDIIGGSFNPSILIQESNDYSDPDLDVIKNNIVDIMTSPITGIDGKLWIIQHISKCRIIINNIEIDCWEDMTCYHETTMVTVITPSIILQLPKYGITLIHCDDINNTYSIENVEKWLNRYLTQQTVLTNLSVPANAPSAQYCLVNTINTLHHKPKDLYPVHFFSYLHGISGQDQTKTHDVYYGNEKKENIAHGHLSFIQIISDDAQCGRIGEIISQELNYSIFLNKKHVYSLSSHQVAVSYTSRKLQIEYKAWFCVDDQSKHKIIVLENEPTLNDIVEYIIEKYHDMLQSINAKGIYVSEGLSQGLYVNFN